MVIGKNEVRVLYRRRAPSYDSTMWLFRMVGFSVDRYRCRAVSALDLGPGDTVVDLGCGTGLNFPLLQNAIGPNGHLIGVDLTDAMLTVAESRVRDAGWQNVTLEQADLAEYKPPASLNGAISTFAITLVPEFDLVVRNVAARLAPRARLAVFDFKRPEAWPEPLVQFAAWLNSPFGVSLDLEDRHPWESIRQHLHEVEFEEFYRGVVYLSVGESLTA